MPIRLLEELVALVVPPACLACRRPLRRAADALCAPCRRALPWLGSATCARCALAGHGAGAPACPARSAPWSAAWAVAAHEGPARALVAALKFRGAVAAADLMAAQMAAGAPRALLEGAQIVPAPAHPRRRRARGFDQSELIAAALARRTGLALAPCLVRGGASTRQLGAGRRERLAAGRIVIGCSAPPPLRAVLVDDVHTTGATLAACARALRGAGAAEVVCLTYARSSA